MNSELDLLDKTAADPYLQLKFHRHVIRRNIVLGNHNAVSIFGLFVDSISAGCPKSAIYKIRCVHVDQLDKLQLVLRRESSKQDEKTSEEGI